MNSSKQTKRGQIRDRTLRNIAERADNKVMKETGHLPITSYEQVFDDIEKKAVKVQHIGSRSCVLRFH